MLYEQFIHFTLINLRRNRQLLSTQQHANLQILVTSYFDSACVIVACCSGLILDKNVNMNMSSSYPTTIIESIFGQNARISDIISSPEPSGSQGELIVYPWSGVRRPSASVVVRRPSTFFKHLLLRNRLAEQTQILFGASLGRGNESLYKWSGSHDQDGRHTHIC